MIITVRGNRLSIIEWLSNNVGAYEYQDSYGNWYGEGWMLGHTSETIMDVITDRLPLYVIAIDDEQHSALFLLRWA